jgi:type VI secretion system secreted protein VgrG
MITEITLSSDNLPECSVATFLGKESISNPYQVEIVIFMSHDDSESFEMSDAMNARATLRVEPGEGRESWIIHGIIDHMEHIHEFREAGVYQLVIRPQLWQLTHSFHSQVFVNKNIPDILEQVLKDGGLTSSDYELQLSGTYDPYEHVCQYRETHFNFLSRWMEHEGMYYFFEQGDDREKLIITDDISRHETQCRESPVLFYQGSVRDAMRGEAMQKWSCKFRTLPSKVTLNDYDDLNPSLNVTGSSPISSLGLGEICIHAENFLTPDYGKALAKIRAEELSCRETLFHGEGNVMNMRTGFQFSLEEHPKSSFNQDYLIVELIHQGQQGSLPHWLHDLLLLDMVNETYHVKVSAIPTGVQFRPQRTAQRPAIYGMVNAVIDGEAESEYAQVDDHGRYFVRIKFDESGLEDGKASTRVRMMQPHGGSVEGFHFPLRKGTEVLLVFLGGDPDRPMIAGVVPNAHKKSVITSSNHTKNIIQTGGLNRLEMEDLDGSQRVTLSTPTQNTYLRMGKENDDKNFILSTDRHGLMHTGADLYIDVVGDQSIRVHTKLNEVVDSDVYEHYKAKESTLVDDDKFEQYGAKQTTLVTGNVTEFYDADHKKTTFGASETNIFSGEKMNVFSGRETKVSGGDKLTVNGAHKITSNGGQTINVTGDVGEKISGKYEQTIGGEFKQTVNANSTWSCFADFIGLKGGATSETFVGIKNGNMIGGQLETFVGIKTEMAMAVKIELHVGLTAKTCMAPEVEIFIVKLAMLQTKLENIAGPKLENAAVRLGNAGIHIIS